MERMTFVDENGEVLFHPADMPEDEGATITQLAAAKRYTELIQIAERLANMEQRVVLYEKKKEHGRLIELPCKVGNYVIFAENGEIKISESSNPVYAQADLEYKQALAEMQSDES